MAACSYCSARKGKRPCPALGGEICQSCCGQHRLVEIACPPDCRWLGGLAVVRGGVAATFTKDDYFTATDKLDAFVASPRGKAAHRDALGYLAESDPRPVWLRAEPMPAWLEPMVVAFVGYGHRGDDGLRAIDRYLAAYGRELSRAEAAALVALQKAWPSLFAITSVRAGAGFTARDLLLDDELEVREASASGHLDRGDVIFAWMMQVGDAVEMTGPNVIVPPEIVEGVHEELEAELACVEQEQPGAPPRQLLGDIADVALVAIFRQLWNMAQPRLETTDGEVAVFGLARFAIHEASEVRARLHTLADLAPLDPLDANPTGPAFTWLDQSPRSLLGTAKVLGRIRLEADALVLETSSRERLTRGRAMLERHLGALVTHREDTFTDPREIVGDRDRGLPPRDRAGELPPDVEAELLGNFLTEHYRRWLDVPVPALRRQTPRQAAATATGRAEVAGLLDDFELGARDQPRLAPGLWNELRRELGIPER